MTETQISERANKHGLKLFKMKPVVQEAFLLVDTQRQKVAGKFPMTAQQVETYLDDLDEQHDTEK